MRVNSTTNTPTQHPPPQVSPQIRSIAPQPPPTVIQPTNQPKPMTNGHAHAPAQPKPIAIAPLDVKKEEPMEVDKAETVAMDADVRSNSVVERQKAIVKPQVLTHVIEGFVIQEGPEPFPVSARNALMIN